MSALVVGGANGIGLAVATLLAQGGKHVFVADRVEPASGSCDYIPLDLATADYSAIERVKAETDTLVFTAGFGRLALFEDVAEEEMVLQMTVNTLAPMRVVRMFYDKIKSGDTFYTAVMVSVAGMMASPFFATYGASKAALNVFISSLNAELEGGGSCNRILNVSPGSFKGSRFNGAAHTDLAALTPLATEIIDRMYARERLFIPQYEEVYGEVLRRAYENPEAEARHSYEYKLARIRNNSKQ